MLTDARPEVECSIGTGSGATVEGAVFVLPGEAVLLRPWPKPQRALRAEWYRRLRRLWAAFGFATAGSA